MAPSGIKESIVSSSGAKRSEACSARDDKVHGDGKSFLNMNFTEYYNRVINWPGRSVLLGTLAVAVGLLIVAIRYSPHR